MRRDDALLKISVGTDTTVTNGGHGYDGALRNATAGIYNCHEAAGDEGIPLNPPLCCSQSRGIVTCGGPRLAVRTLRVSLQLELGWSWEAHEFVKICAQNEVLGLQAKNF